MAKNQHSFAKRQREMDKKRKAEDKRARRRERKDEGVDGGDGAFEQPGLAPLDQDFPADGSPSEDAGSGEETAAPPPAPDAEKTDG